MSLRANLLLCDNGNLNTASQPSCYSSSSSSAFCSSSTTTSSGSASSVLPVMVSSPTHSSSSGGGKILLLGMFSTHHSLPPLRQITPVSGDVSKKYVRRVFGEEVSCAIQPKFSPQHFPTKFFLTARKTTRR
jgi:hypothetical protein